MNGLVRIEEKVVFDRIGFNVQIDEGAWRDGVGEEEGML